MLSTRAAFVLRVHAFLLFFVSVAFILQPLKMVHTLGFPSASLSDELSWTLRGLGILLLAPALLAPLVAAFAGERGLRQACAGMGFITALLSGWLLLSPGSWSSAKVITVALTVIITGGYFFALKGRRRNR